MHEKVFSLTNKKYEFKLPIRLTELQRLINPGVGKGID